MAHLQRARNWRQIPVPECSFPGCGRGIHAHGLCNSHDQQQRRGVPLRPLRLHQPRPGVPCKVSGCGEPVYASGTCRPHWAGQRRGRAPHQPAPSSRWCTVPQCGRVLFARGICYTHWRRKRDGEPDWDRPIKQYVHRFGPIAELLPTRDADDRDGTPAGSAPCPP